MLHVLHEDTHEVWFCTVTCYRWLPLFEESGCYFSVYRWFEHLKRDGCHVLGYVIMPNHFHALLFPTHKGISLNRLVGNGKRFMAYDIVQSLKKSGKNTLLETLSEGVQRQERLRGKLHQVFRLSFDARKCYSEKMIEQKLNYIHQNPVRGKWQLADDFTRYDHSSAGFYELGVPGKFAVTHYKLVGSDEILPWKASESPSADG